MEKICSKCKQTLSIDNFSIDKNQKSGFACRCKKCRREDKKKAYYKDHKITLLNMRQYRNLNKEKINLKIRIKNGWNEKVLLSPEERIKRRKECQKKYRLKNANKIKEYRKNRRLNDPFILEKDKNYRNKHYQKHKILVDRWRKNNPDKSKIFNNMNTIKISNGYVAKIFGIPVSEVPPDLIEAKRIQIQILRYCKQH